MKTTNDLKVSHPLPSVAEKYGVSLKQTGRGWMCLCPFHDDHHPSMTISLYRGDFRFRCWSCGKDGDVIDWVGFHEYGDAWNNGDKAMFKRACELLGAEQVQPISIEHTSEAVERPLTRSVQFIWDQALSLWTSALRSEPDVLAYLHEERQIPSAMLQKYRFGLCYRDGGNLHAMLNALFPGGQFNMDKLVDAGIYKRSFDDGHPYPAFISRITFADVDAAGKPLFVYSRSFPGSSANPSRPKYLYPLGYKKPVFGLATLSQDSKSPVLLLEGQINKMFVENWGLDAIAVSGAKPSDEQIAAVKERLGKRLIVPVVDNDDPGFDALAQWQALFDRVSPTPLLLPPEINNKPVKDVNDFAVAAGNEAEGIFMDLLRKVIK